MSLSNADRNLLLGIIALQMDFVSRNHLIEAMNAWVLDKSRSLSEILVEKGNLTAGRKQLLDALVQEHLKQHEDDPQKSLAAVSSIKSVREDLEKLVDPDVAASLVHVSQNAPSVDPYATRAANGGEFPSTGTRFRILRPHAKGGLGQVSVALDEELHREVALKEIQPQHADREDSRGRFLVEAEITGGLEHPGIVPVYSLGSYQDGRPYYAMRFIKGDNLKEAIERFHRSSPSPVGSEPAGYESVAFRNLLGRFLDVCNAIAYAHSRGVLHRDLKPGNIMLGDYGETLVVDWGLAKSLKQIFHAGSSPAETGPLERPLKPRSGSGSAPTIEGSAIGTPQFMSPEQAAGRIEELGPASDVYSLGATLYCVLTGDPPFGGDSIEDVLRNVQRGEFSRPRAVNEHIPKPLEAITLKAMANNPGDRYGSAKDLAQEVERYLADEPVLAYVEPWVVRARRWMKQHRSLVTGTAAAAFVALVGLMIGLFLVGNYNRELASLNRTLDNRNEELTTALRREQTALAAEAAQRREAERLAVEEQKQRAEAERQEDIAVAERDRAKTVTEMLVLAFRSPSPERDGRTITVAEVLHRAVKELPEYLKDDPITLASLLLAIGDSFRGLGLPHDAIHPLESARNLRTEHLGPDHPDTLGSQGNLAHTYHHAGRLDEAITLHEQTLKAFIAKLGPDHIDTLTIQNNLALAYQAAGRREEAISLQEQTLKTQKTTLGSDHSDTITSQSNLALAYLYAGRFREALPLCEQTLEARKAKLGPDHPDTLTSQNNLASAYESAGRLEEAISLYEQTLTARKAILGPNHSDTLGSQHNLALAYQAAGRLEEAIPLLEQTLTAFIAKLGPDHPSTLTSQNGLASAYESVGRLEEAIPLHEQTLKALIAKFGPDHPNTLTSQNNLALAYRAAGRHEDAIPLHEQTLKAKKATLGPDHPGTLLTVHNLGKSLINSDRPAEAEGLLAEWRPAIDADRAAHWATPKLLVIQGMAQRRTGKLAIATETLTDAYAKLVAKGNNIPPTYRNDWLGEAATEVATAHAAQNHANQALAWRHEASKYGRAAVAEPREGFVPIDLKPTAKPVSE